MKSKMSREFTSNEELFKAIENLQKALFVDGHEQAANEIKEGFACLNGLTDGWALLMEGLEKANKEYGMKFTEAQRTDLQDILSCVKKAVSR